MCRRFCCYAYLAPTGSASHWSFEQETEEEQIRGSTLLLQDNATQPMSHHRVNHFDAFQGWLQHQQCCIIQSVMETEGMSIYLFHKNDPKKESSQFICAHILYACVYVYVYIYISIVSHLPCGHWEQDSKAMSKSWQENMELLSNLEELFAKQPRRALCPSQTLKDFKGAPLWATLHNQLKPN